MHDQSSNLEFLELWISKYLVKMLRKVTYKTVNSSFCSDEGLALPWVPEVCFSVFRFFFFNLFKNFFFD